MYSRSIDIKWQTRWTETGLYKFDPHRLEDAIYCIEMFSYPSGAKLHLGHWYNFGLTDIWTRMKMLQGYNVLHPQGFDAFGLPAENYAIRAGVHPKDSTYKNIDTMRRQLAAIGMTTDWHYEVVTSDPAYYRWTQWLFILFYKHGLAYRKKAPVNWCDSCRTVLANEQVVDGKCERCDSSVSQRELTQWFLKITDYAQELHDAVEPLDWPDKTKKIQQNWIGPSRGAYVDFAVAGAEDSPSLRVFTTRPDTLYGSTYVLVAPEHPLVRAITKEDQKAEVEEYVRRSTLKSDLDRIASQEKTGVFTGAHAINPINGRHIPIWTADYVVASYGTGAIMAVPAHDSRDYDFAVKFGLPIEVVIRPVEQDADVQVQLPFCERGVMINSGPYSGLSSDVGEQQLIGRLHAEGTGESTTVFRLRDWLVSRQRYWGAPIPMVHCPKCGIVPVPEADLPVELPYDVEFRPTGESPLSLHTEFVNVLCPACGTPAKRDTDTLDTFVDSSWYYLRYPDPKNGHAPFDPEVINKILPVDKYVGGQEHASMHLLYARFFTKVLCDLGYLSFREPFPSLLHQGVILGPDGAKMSKSRGNTISADHYVNQYGSDVLRLYLCFGFRYTDGGPWSDDGIYAMAQFVSRVWNFIESSSCASRPSREELPPTIDTLGRRELNRVVHATVKAVSTDLERFKFNTCIARLMECFSAMQCFHTNHPNDIAMLRYAANTFIILLSPFAPHLGEELWSMVGGTYSVFNQSWPTWDEKRLLVDQVEMTVHVNGKVRAQIMAERDADEEKIRSLAFAEPAIVRWTQGKEVVKVVLVKNRVVNIVCRDR